MNDSLEISVKGRWVRVPALNVNRQTIIVKGKWLKIASIHDEIWLEEEVIEPADCVKQLKEQSTLRADIFTFTQRPMVTLAKYPYHVELDSVAVIHLSTFENWWNTLPQEARKNVRRSQKRGVMVKVRPFDNELVERIRDVNNDSPFRQKERNLHYGKSNEQTKRDHISFLDRSDFIVAYFGDDVIGYAKIVYRGRVASILNFAPKASHQDKRPANALMAKVVELCVARNISQLTYGMFNYGNKRQSSLREFKQRNGFQELLVPRYYAPLSLWGAVSIKLRLHRSLLEILPERVISLAIRVRSKWQRIKEWITSSRARVVAS